ncbi:NAD(P)-dependent alcohol dehydrogenase [Nitriliruptoria bacterium AS10]|nr:NAD(P)-dependent alcohol dehydrogenase [Salsipaludibacter albus]
MEAITQSSYTSPHQLRLTTVATPSPGPGQVLVEVAAAGIDQGVWHLVTGRPYVVRLAGYGIRKPRQSIPGFDLSGRVVAVGSDVAAFDVGDRVFGIGIATFAQYAVAETAKLSRVPDGITDEQAAVAAISGGAALQAVDDVAGVQPDMRVLVIGASGGVGSYAVQLAVARGATVTGVASAAKADLVRDLGADHVIAYDRDSLDSEGVEYDVVLSIGGLAPVRTLRRLLTPTGTLVIVGAEGGSSITGGLGRQLRAVLWSPFVGQRMTTFIAREHRDVVDRLADDLASGAVVPAIGHTVGLAEVPDTIGALRAGRLRGKAVVQIGAGGVRSR